MPNSLSITFHADSWDDLTRQMRLALGREPVDTPAPMRSYTDFPADGEALEPDDPDAVVTEPEPEPAPAPKRSHKAKTPVAQPAPTAATEPAPPLVSTKRESLPPLDTLKSAVTRAVRAAQKKEGPTKILDLLPGFKKATGLDFVMSAEDKHRQALMELAEAADLELA